MDETQLKVVNYLQERENVLLLGQAGTGKSMLVKNLKSHLKNRHIVVTSTTGVSAFSIGGTTLHSFLGIGLGKDSKEELLKKVKRNSRTVQILKNPRLLLVIDEISMLPLCLFEKIDWIFQKIKGNTAPFGAVQMLITGDFLQLEPPKEISIYKSTLLNCFKIVYLLKNYRQSSDDIFQGILTRLRVGKLTEEDINLLKDREKIPNIDEKAPIKLFSTNKAVNDYNNKHILENTNKAYTFEAKFTGINTYYLNDIKNQFKAKNIDTLLLKKGMRVMLTRNFDVNAGVVNGSIGVVKSLLGVPVVEFFNGLTLPIDRVVWELRVDDEVVATGKQFPLVPAYASTIHKCQGLTITSAIIDLKNIFAPHMIYVALSRVTSLEGVHLLNFNPEKVKVNQDTVDFYQKLLFKD